MGLMYLPCKTAMNAIMHCAFRLYKDKNIVSYGIAPYCCKTNLLLNAANVVGVTLEQVWGDNPFSLEGNPEDIGNISATVVQGANGLNPVSCMASSPSQLSIVIRRI